VRCCLCKINGESVDHLLFYCEVVDALWNAIQPLQFFLGYASSGGRFIRLLVNGWSLSECNSVEDGSFLPFLVLVEGTE
jgi:hypothetical protein